MTGPAAFIYSGRFGEYSYGAEHPCNALRYRLAYELIRELGLLEHPAVKRIESPLASEQALLCFHRRDYLAALREFSLQAEPRADFRYGLGDVENPVFGGMYDWARLATARPAGRFRPGPAPAGAAPGLSGAKTLSAARPAAGGGAMTFAASPLRDRHGVPLLSLGDINRLPRDEKEAVYSRLIPEAVFERFGIDRETFCGRDGRRQVHFICPQGLGLLRVEVRLQPADRDGLFFAEIADTPYRQVELAFCLVADPQSPRYDIDVDENGRDNCFGTLRRNIGEELRAMAAGLFPNQVRCGLGLFAPFFRRLERLVAELGVDTIVVEPLSYGNAIRYEGFGFDYITGKQLMLRIDREFPSGGRLHRRLDGSSPFRQGGMEGSLRGRSWAIHDGILRRPWDGVRLYKVPGTDAGIDTFPDRES